MSAAEFDWTIEYNSGVKRRAGGLRRETKRSDEGGERTLWPGWMMVLLTEPVYMSMTIGPAPVCEEQARRLASGEE